MEKKYLIAEYEHPDTIIINQMIDDAAKEVSEEMDYNYSDCLVYIDEQVNNADWMLVEEDENGQAVIEKDFLFRFLSDCKKTLEEIILDERKEENENE